VRRAGLPAATGALTRDDRIMTTVAALPSRTLAALRGCVAVFAIIASAALAQPAWQSTSEGLAPIPALKARVTDVTNTLTSGEMSALETKLADWEQKSGNQLVVLLVPTTRGEPIEGYSLRVAEAWKIGRKGQDNGALFVVAKDDRKMRIEVGYGLEGVLTDVTSSAMIRRDVTSVRTPSRP
jgi:uncharacterized protein